MQSYYDLNGNSGIVAFEVGVDYITVQFSTGALYTYSYRSAGIEKVENMKRLAVQGSGLNSYINRYARKDYER